MFQSNQCSKHSPRQVAPHLCIPHAGSARLAAQRAQQRPGGHPAAIKLQARQLLGMWRAELLQAGACGGRVGQAARGAGQGKSSTSAGGPQLHTGKQQVRCTSTAAQLPSSQRRTRFFRPTAAHLTLVSPASGASSRQQASSKPVLLTSSSARAVRLERPANWSARICRGRTQFAENVGLVLSQLACKC